MSGGMFFLGDPNGQIEMECADPHFAQADVAMTYAMAIAGQHVVPVDWPRANAVIQKRWPKGLVRVKEKAWKMIKAKEESATLTGGDDNG